MRVRVFMLNGLQEPVLVAERELEEALLIVMTLVAIEKKAVIVEPAPETTAVLNRKCSNV